MPRDLQFLNKWMQRTDMGNVYLHGEDRYTWSNEEWVNDLAVLATRTTDDAFFQWVYDTAFHWFHRAFGRHFKVSSSCTIKMLGIVSLTSR